MGGVASAVAKGAKVAKPVGKLKPVKPHEILKKGLSPTKPVGELKPVSSEQLRQLRRIQGGYTTEAYHGSTHPNIEEFHTNNNASANYWGRATYLTSSTEDMNANYATPTGGDLTARIEERAEDLYQDFLRIGDEGIYGKGKIAGIPFWKMRAEIEAEDYEELARVFAEKELVGEGATAYPAYVNTENFAQIGGKTPTVIDEWDEAKLYQTLEDAFFNTGLLEREAPNDFAIVSDTIDDLLIDFITYGELSLERVDKQIRSKIWLMEDEFKNTVEGGELSKRVIQQLGYDGILDYNVDMLFGTQSGRFKPMEGVTPDTYHVIVFPDKENLIKSKFAQFKDLDSKNITAAVSGVGMLTALTEEEDSGKPSDSN